MVPARGGWSKNQCAQRRALHRLQALVRLASRDATHRAVLPQTLWMVPLKQAAPPK